jgi:hypothetical protein
MENRNGLVVAAQASCSSTAAEREAALAMLEQVVKAPAQRASEAELTLGADTEYQDGKFIAALRERAVAPHGSEYTKGAASLGKNALNEQERADPRRSISQRRRKLIERVFGWAKLDRPLQQIKRRGLKRVDWFYRLVVRAYNLMRMGKLIAVGGSKVRGEVSLEAVKRASRDQTKPSKTLPLSPKAAIDGPAREPEKKKLGFFRSLFSPALPGAPSQRRSGHFRGKW